MSNKFVIEAKETIDGALFIGYGDNYYNNFMIIGLDEIKFDELSTDEKNAIVLKDYIIKNDTSNEIIEINEGLTDGTINAVYVSLTTTDIRFDDIRLLLSEIDE